MAKIHTCPICGTEYQGNALIGRNAGTLTFGKLFGREASFCFNCCKDCETRFEDIAKAEGTRFAIKLSNLKKASRRKIKDEDVAKMFLLYLEGRKAYSPYEGEEGFIHHFLYLTPDGHFSMNEFDTTVVDFSTKDYLRSLDRIFTFENDRLFTAKDVSRLEYRQVGFPERGLFSSIVTFEIRFNDEKELTYKPCIARYVVVSRGLFPVRKAHRMMKNILEEFKEHTGVRLPVVRVKKFR